jgi:glutamyl-tRNA reductase
MSDKDTTAKIEVNIGEDLMAQAVRAAMLQLFSPEKQTQMVQAAIQNLLTRPAKYNKECTEIEDILDTEVRRWVGSFAAEMVDKNVGGIRDKMEELVARGMSRFLADEEMQEKMAEKLSKVLGNVFLYGRDY